MGGVGRVVLAGATALVLAAITVAGCGGGGGDGAESTTTAHATTTVGSEPVPGETYAGALEGEAALSGDLSLVVAASGVAVDEIALDLQMDEFACGSTIMNGGFGLVVSGPAPIGDDGSFEASSDSLTVAGVFESSAVASGTADGSLPIPGGEPCEWGPFPWTVNPAGTSRAPAAESEPAPTTEEASAAIDGEWYRLNPDGRSGASEIEFLSCVAGNRRVECEYEARADEEPDAPVVNAGKFFGRSIAGDDCEAYLADICAEAVFVASGTVSFEDGTVPKLTLAIQGDGSLHAGWDDPFEFYCPWFRTVDEALRANPDLIQDCVGL